MYRQTTHTCPSRGFSDSRHCPPLTLDMWLVPRVRISSSSKSSSGRSSGAILRKSEPCGERAGVVLAMLHEEQMQSYTRYLEGKKFETTVGPHRIITDQAVSDGGSDAGATPPELLLASLGACAGHYAMEYLRTRSLCLTGLEIRVSAEKGTQPARLASFRVEVCVPEIEERHRHGLLHAVKACLIHNTLTTTLTVEVDVLILQKPCRLG